MHRFDQLCTDGKFLPDRFISFRMLRHARAGRTFARLVSMAMGLLVLALFLPWTQNIRADGFLTTLRPEQRPQTVPAVIGGKIEGWRIREGQKVQRGDTLLILSETKTEYFDPLLLDRTRRQIDAKAGAQDAYRQKVGSLDDQMAALTRIRDLKLAQGANKVRQAELTVIADSNDMVAARIHEAVAMDQFHRMKQLHADGLNSLTDLEARQLKLQEATAKAIREENAWLASQNSLINARVELVAIQQEYRDKLAKAGAERAAAVTDIFGADADIAKMEGLYSNYAVRSGFYAVTAPQTGYVTRVIRAGIGETVKEGEALLSIVPADVDLAVEMYIRPVDLPLIRPDHVVRFVFDGWPAIVFSGWPNASYGAFGGRVVAIDRFVSPNGQYRVLVAPDPEEASWPDGLRIGSGAVGLALLGDVPLWYELWRQLNGFPPNFYTAREVASPKADKGMMMPEPTGSGSSSTGKK